jgi:uncharacterized protein YndB with AHSA1/START domain
MRINMSATENIKLIYVSRKEIYKAFTDPEALVQWLVPGEMAIAHDVKQNLEKVKRHGKRSDKLS